MIGIDTNVILRAFWNDDPVQSPRAARLLADAGDGNAFVSVVVVMEAARVARRKKGMDRERLALMVEALLETRELQVEHRPVLVRALASFRVGPAGFEDCLIAELNREAGCSTTYTFVADAIRNPSFTPVPA